MDKISKPDQNSGKSALGFLFKLPDPGFFAVAVDFLPQFVHRKEEIQMQNENEGVMKQQKIIVNFRCP